MTKIIDFNVFNRFSGEVQFTAQIEADEASPIGHKLRLAVLWAIKNDANLKHADLARANLRFADLARADLRSTNLTRADLTCANLRHANLRHADLRHADLTCADLRFADLARANLRSTNLTHADLRSTNLTRAKNLGNFVMSDGLTFNQYLKEVVPALLTAGGKTMDEIQASGCWDCHTWTNCPMHVAFDILDPSQGPALLRGRIVEFIQFFDAKMIPPPWAEPISESV